MPVELTPTAAKEFERLPRALKARVMVVMNRLDAWPRVSGAKPLTGELAGRFRIRTGDYRVQSYVRGVTVVIEKIGHRDSFYEG